MKRVIVIALALALAPVTAYYAEDPSARREDNILVFDVRAEKTIKVSNRARLRGFVDFFNITNSHQSEFITGRPAPTSCALLASWRRSRRGSGSA